MTVVYEKGFGSVTLEKIDGSCPLGDDDLFTIAGGSVWSLTSMGW